jgi:hypothetical protein
LIKEQKTNIVSKCPSAYKLDAALLFGLDAETAGHLEHCPKCAALRRKTAAADEEFNTRVFPQTVDSVVERALLGHKDLRRSLHAGFGSRMIWTRVLPVAAAAMVAVIVGFLFWERSTSVATHREEYIGDKGGIGLEVWCKRNATVFRVNQGEKLRVDDMIRFVPRFAAGDSLFLMVVSVDGNGTVSRYFPETSDTALMVVKSGEPLAGSTILDATSGPERVWLLSSEEVFYFQDVRKAIESEWKRAGGADRMDALALQLDQAGLFFIKEGAD